jgi:hypothetical protein
MNKNYEKTSGFFSKSMTGNRFLKNYKRLSTNHFNEISLIVYFKNGAFTDSKISRIVHKSEDGAGTFMPTMTRDISFSFKRLKALKYAIIRLINRLDNKVKIEVALNG